jgi:flagellar biogenesis protein FliO
MSAADTVEMMARIGGGLLVVVALVFVSARVARRVRGQTGDSGLRVVDRVVLSREAHLAVVQAGGRRLLLGVTPQRVSLVGTLGEGEIVDDATAAVALGSISSGVAEPEPAIEDAPDLAEPGIPSYQPDTPAPADEAPLPTRRRRRARHAAAPANDGPEQFESPATSPAPAPAPQRLTPSGVDLSGHPDLASALRAAGRTMTSPDLSAPALATPQPPPVPAQSSRAGSRAAARAEAAETAAAQALLEAAQAPVQAAAQQAGRPASPVPQQRRQASGSVLSPATWKQGIEALRELTVRRG